MCDSERPALDLDFLIDFPRQLRPRIRGLWYQVMVRRRALRRIQGLSFRRGNGSDDESVVCGIW